MWVYQSELREKREADENDPFMKTYRNQLCAMRNDYKRTPLAELPFTVFKRYDTDGNRTEYEALYFDRRGRLTTLALCAWLWEKQEDIERLEDVLWAICNEFTWALPAHMGGKSLTDEVNPMEIDLFAAETAGTLAEILSLVGAKLSDAVCHRCRNEVFRRVLSPYHNRTKPYHWELACDNWCAVCAGNIGIAAIYLMQDIKELEDILEQLQPVLLRYLDSFSDDGACLEGLSYWTYGMTYFTAFLDLMQERTGSTFELPKDKIKQIADFPQKCCLGRGNTVSFSDGCVRDKLSMGLACKLHEWYKSDIPSLEYAAYPKNDACHRWCRAFRDIAWTNTRYLACNTQKKSICLPHAQWAILHGNEGTSAAIKGGHNAEPHNHNDIGAFLFFKNGRELICDLGAGEYTKDYFGQKRYDIFCNGAMGHSVPIINGISQSQGKSFAADMFQMGTQNESTLQLQGAYPNLTIKMVQRHIKLEKENGLLMLHDQFNFTQKGNHVIERFITQCSVKVEKKQILLFDNQDQVGILKIISPIEKITVTKVEHRTHDGRLVTVNAIDSHLEGNEIINFYAQIG